MKWMLFAIAIPFLAACGDNEPTKPRPVPAEPYPGPWQESFHQGIAQAFMQNQTRGCGQFKYRPSAEYGGEYLVWCTADGRNWMEYLVWLPSQNVKGPFRPRGDLQ